MSDTIWSAAEPAVCEEVDDESVRGVGVVLLVEVVSPPEEPLMKGTVEDREEAQKVLVAVLVVELVDCKVGPDLPGVEVVERDPFDEDSCSRVEDKIAPDLERAA